MNNIITGRWLYLLLLVVLSGCSADIEDYRQSQPQFDLFQYFEGDVTAWGMVQDYSGKQTRRFSVQIKGTVTGEQLVLTEDFVFDDGEQAQRIWTIKHLGDGRYEGEADDIIGVARGTAVGNALRWQYDFEIEVDGSTYDVAFDDWLYRQDDRHLFNLTKIKKFGIEVGQITLFFQRN